MDFEKIKNFLYYNRLKLFFFAFVIIFLVVTFKQCSQRAEIDLGVMYVGEAVVSDKLPLLAEEIKDNNIVADADADGEITLNSKAIVIPASKEKMIEQQVPEQIQVEIISGENLLYILGKSTLISYAVDESFADITAIAEKYNISRDKCFSYDDGRIYAIPVEGNALFDRLAIESAGMYVAVRNYMEKDKDKLTNINAINALEYIIQNGGGLNEN